jgi:hypothetical protein
MQMTGFSTKFTSLQTGNLTVLHMQNTDQARMQLSAPAGGPMDGLLPYQWAQPLPKDVVESLNDPTKHVQL